MSITGRTVDAIMQEPIIFRITVNNPGILHRLKILPKQRGFILKPLVLGTLLRISKEINKIQFEEESFKRENLIAKTFDRALTDTNILVNIIALSIINKKKLPGRRLKKFILENLTAKQMFQLFTMIASQVNVNDFMTSIILIKGVSLIKEGETIAPGEQSEESKNISGSE